MLQCNNITDKKDLHPQNITEQKKPNHNERNTGK